MVPLGEGVEGVLAFHGAHGVVCAGREIADVLAVCAQRRAAVAGMLGWEFLRCRNHKPARNYEQACEGFLVGFGQDGVAQAVRDESGSRDKDVGQGLSEPLRNALLQPYLGRFR